MQTIQLQGHTHTLCVPLSVFLHGPPTAPPETGERPFHFSDDRGVAVKEDKRKDRAK